jgi:hypothetical protein
VVSSDQPVLNVFAVQEEAESEVNATATEDTQLVDTGSTVGGAVQTESSGETQLVGVDNPVEGVGQVNSSEGTQSGGTDNLVEGTVSVVHGKSSRGTSVDGLVYSVESTGGTVGSVAVTDQHMEYQVPILPASGSSISDEVETPASPAAPEERGEVPTFHIMVRIGSSSEWIKALVDTGSDRTLISDSVRVGQVSPYLLRLRSAGGEEMRVRGKCKGTIWAMDRDGHQFSSKTVWIVVQHATFGVLLGKDWIKANVHLIDISEHCLWLKCGRAVVMVQGDPTTRPLSSYAVTESKPVHATTGLGFAIRPWEKQEFILNPKRDNHDVGRSIPSMTVILPQFIQLRVDCELHWTSSGELRLSTINNSGMTHEVEPGTVVAVEDVSAANQWNGFAFSLFDHLRIPPGPGTAVVTVLKSSRPVHYKMRLSLQQVMDEESAGSYLIHHTGNLGGGLKQKSSQQVTVVNLTAQELVLMPGVPLMIHVDDEPKAKSQEEVADNK